MSLIKEILSKQDQIILDGALGTQIQVNGYDINDSLWSAKYLDKNPEVIKEVHRQYLEAGADCIITSSYQASIEGFINKGFSENKAIEFIKSSVFIAQEVRDEFWKKNLDVNRIKPLVAASIGPYGAFLADGSEYTGIYYISDEKLKAFHKRRLEIICETKPDLLAIETIPSFKEAMIILELLKEYKNISSYLTFSAKNEYFTNANDELKKCWQYLDKCEHIEAIGVNCTAPQYISKIIEDIKEISSKQIIVYLNGGSRYNPITKQWEKGDIKAHEFAKMAQFWYTKGAKFIGGCCETRPEEIKAIRKCLLK